MNCYSGKRLENLKKNTVQGSNNLFRSDSGKCSEQFQQLGDMGGAVISPIGASDPKCYPNARK